MYLKNTGFFFFFDYLIFYSVSYKNKIKKKLSTQGPSFPGLNFLHLTCILKFKSQRQKKPNPACIPKLLVREPTQSLPRKRLQHVYTFEQFCVLGRFMRKSSSMLECPGSDWRCVMMQNKSVVPAEAMWSEVAELKDLKYTQNICRLKEDLWILLRERLVSPVFEETTSSCI